MTVLVLKQVTQGHYERVLSSSFALCEDTDTIENSETVIAPCVKSAHVQTDGSPYPLRKASTHVLPVGKNNFESYTFSIRHSKMIAASQIGQSAKVSGAFVKQAASRRPARRSCVAQCSHRGHEDNLVAQTTKFAINAAVAATLMVRISKRMAGNITYQVGARCNKIFL